MIVYCPICKTDTVVSEHHDACGFCATRLISYPPHRTYGTGVHAARGPAQRCIREPDVTDAYRLYQTGLSVMAVARIIHPRTTYSSLHGCAQALIKHFKLRGWPLRSQRAAIALSGQARKQARGRRDNETFHQWQARLKRERGLMQPRCAGTTTNGPRRGQPCARTASRGDDFCFAHSPARAAQRAAAIAQLHRVYEELHPPAAVTP